MSTATLAESVAAALRDLILRGQYVAGDRLVEISLAREIGVSQNTVRDALSLLEQEGWVAKQARRGVFVRSFTVSEAEELYTLIVAVESVALEWALDNMNDAWLASLRHHLAAARQAADAGQGAQATASLLAFHESLALHDDKPLTNALLGRLLNAARLLEALRLARRPNVAGDLDEHLVAHEMLLRALTDDDRSGAQMALLRVISTQRARVLDLL